MKKLLTVSFVAATLFAGQAMAASSGEELFKSMPCMACHSIETKMVGPSLKDVAAKNAEVDGAAAILAKNIKEGSQGVWGPIPMPANAVTEEQATILAEWILSLK
jgi:cytochrome c